MVGRSNVVFAALLAHLAEVEARRVFRERACSSLYAYCVYELRMSEDAAQRRVQAARLVRKFPELLEVVAAGELHLTGLLLLGPHLTHENLAQVLPLAKHRSKREILALVRRLDPKPNALARIEPLGPAVVNAACGGTWEQWTGSFAPVNHLQPGDRPRDWIPCDAGATDEVPGAGGHTDDRGEPSDSSNDAAGTRVHGEGDAGVVSGTMLPAGAHVHGSLTAPQRYKVQFTASEEHVQLLQEARDLLGPALKGRAIEEVHLRAMQALVRELKKRKFAMLEGPRAAAKTGTTRPNGADDADTRRCTVNTADTRRRGSNLDDTQERAALDDDTRRRGSNSEATRQHVSPGDALESSRHIPAWVRRAVWERDGGRCTYRDCGAQRCRERSGLEFHHEVAFAKRGRHTVANVCLRCKPHNALAAEQDFGEAHMARVKGDVPH